MIIRTGQTETCPVFVFLFIKTSFCVIIEAIRRRFYLCSRKEWRNLRKSLLMP